MALVDTFYWFHQIRPSDQETVGDVAFYLSSLRQRNYPVLAGCVLTAKLFWEFLESIQLSDPLFVDFPQSLLHLDIKNFRQLQAISRQIRRQILAASLSESLLSTLSTALQGLEAEALGFELDLSSNGLPAQGWFNTFWCLTEIKAVALALKQTWAELFRAKSLFYWGSYGLQIRQLQPVVVVQPLQNAIASGSVQVNPKSWTIQAVRGLGGMLGQSVDQASQIRVDPQTQGFQTDQSDGQTLVYWMRQPDEILGHEALAISQRNLLASGLPTAVPPGMIQVDVVQETQPASPVLRVGEIEALVQLIHQIAVTIPGQWTINWILCPISDSTSDPTAATVAQFYFTRLNPVFLQPEPLSQPDSLSNPSGVPNAWVLQGLAAASGRAIAPAHVVRAETDASQPFVSGSILVMPELTVDWLPLLKFAAGLVTETGGMTGHGAILARELGIPAVLGIAQATTRIVSGSKILVDGERGYVHLQPRSPAKTKLPSVQTSSHGVVDAVDAPGSNLEMPSWPAKLPSINTCLRVNLSQTRSIPRLQKLPIEGVGLLRSELLALDVLYGTPDLEPAIAPTTLVPMTCDFSRWLQPNAQLEFVQKMVRSLQQIASPLLGKPLFYRALDLRQFHQQVRPFWGESSLEFEALSQSSLLTATPQLVTLFDLELAVLSQLHRLGYVNTHLILPFVRSVEEFSVYRRRVEQAGLPSNPQFQLWIMAEVPSVLFLLPDYVKAGVQGIAIGTNDLTQLLLGVDRNHHSAPRLLNETHPACLRAVQQLVETARILNIPCSICGDAPVLYPELIISLIRWGVTSISVNLDAVHKTYQAIAQAEHHLQLEQARPQQND
ncbi:MAG: putative PEP-binding protein [Microcoleaceae cyanobacterium]